MISEYIIPLALLMVLVGLWALSLIETWIRHRKDCNF